MKLSSLLPDFQDIVDQLTSELQTRSSWKDILTSSTGQTLIEFMAAIGTMQLNELERSIQEIYLNTAVNRSSIYAIANMLGVSPRRAVGAEVLVTLQLPSLLATSIPLPKYTKFTIEGVPFFLTQDLTIPANTLLIKDIKLRQGSVSTTKFTSSGGKWQTFFIGSNFTTDNEYIDMTVGQDPAYWQKTSEPLWIYNSTDKVFRHVTNSDGQVSISLGNGTYGVVPNAGEVITLTSVESLGSGGNKSVSELQVSIVVQPTYNSAPVNLTGITTTPISGGDNEEDLDTVRFTSPRVYASGNRAITRADWKSIGLKFPNVKDLNVWGEFEEGSSLNMMNSVIVSMLTSTGTATQLEKDNFTSYINDYKHLTTRLIHRDAVAVLLSLNLNVYVFLGYSLPSIQSTVLSKIKDYFLFKRGTLGRSVQVSDIVDLVKTVEGVDYVTIGNPIAPSNLIAANSPSGATLSAVAGGFFTAGTYFYKITAFVNGQETYAGPETGLTISGGNGTISVVWPLISGATKYRVYRGINTNAENTYFETTLNNYIDNGTGGSSGTPPATGTLIASTLFYSVTAFDSLGLETDKSNQVSVTVINNGSVALSWSAVTGAVSYRVYRGTSSNSFTIYFDTTSTTFVDIGLAGTVGTPPIINSVPVNLSRHQYVKLQPTPIINTFITSR